MKRCEMCGKRHMHLQEHHIIPWHFSHDDSESNITRVCPSCHKKADNNFVSLVMYGRMNIYNETKKRANSRYSKKHMRTKQLFRFKLLKNTYYQDIIHHNTRTGNISIIQYWQYMPYNYTGRSVKSRSQLNKAASAKSQVTLHMYCL